MLYLRRHIIVVFVVLTFLFSWGAWLWVNSTGNELSGWHGLVALLGAFGPSLAGMACAGIAGGWDRVKELLKQLVRWRVSAVLYAAVLLGPLVLVLVPMSVNVFLGGTVPDWLALLSLPVLLPMALRMLLIGGLTEELGWRGFALPILRRDRGPLAASLIVGLVWGVWHLPIYSLPNLGNPLSPLDLVWFVLGTVILAIFFTALAERSRDSVLIAMLFHAWTNTVASELPGLLGVPENIQLRLVNQLFWLLIAALIVWTWLRRARPAIPLGPRRVKQASSGV